MLSSKKKGVFLSIIIFISTSLLSFGLVYAQSVGTQDSNFSFTFGGPLSMKYTDFRFKGTPSSMYINVVSSNDINRPDFKIKPQMDKNGMVSNAGNGGTVRIGKRYEVYNSVNENGSYWARFRGERSTWGSLTFKGKWSPDYIKENGVNVIP
ncbi:MAG: hypothetical protein LBE23_10095 [Vagococcus sp.]|jgi:hypothetical protein|nr:hypothetical protein [Vagococcus sp.]